ncbi:MAG: PQQ-binding-like beta-propeller repeat protein [Oscillospiraceae bacterium]|nr:PQQ-binding-like beta-propeller repeat protein [Oscillospiraceae bacterium]MBQ8881267.1 PQQ-binding-like beta-propeller repeat protein [Oscillospiraceae bacterium]
MNFSVLTAGLHTSESYGQMKSSLILLAIIFSVLLIASIVFTLVASQIKCSRSQRDAEKLILMVMYASTVLILVCTLVCFVRYKAVGDILMSAPPTAPTETTAPIHTEPSSTVTAPTEVTVVPGRPTGPQPTTAPTESVQPTFTPTHSNSSDPKNWGVDWEIIKGGSIVDSIPSTAISFGKPEDYFSLPGIATFRGNNFRNSAVYGTAAVTEKTITKAWSSNIGSLNGWPGSGWTGQPLMVQWDRETKNIMNMFPEKKAKEGLVEVIYATLDGNIYFYDLDDGSYTRNPLYVGMNFKGAGSLDPRGYPIMYVGSGDYMSGKVPRMYIISLIDGSILYEKSGNDAFSLRPDWTAFDSSPLVDRETDTLIWPGENGILYTIKLNTLYDKTAGTLKIQPEELVKTRYYTDRSGTGSYWIGYEPSCVIVDRYLYISENGGMFFCIDLDTMKLVWAQDTRDDSNSTPVFEWDGLDGGYIYTAPSLHWTAKDGKGYISIYKLNAKTGEIVWEQKFNCGTVNGVSGGVQSSPLLGKPGTELEGLILYTVARTPGMWDGKLVAIDTKTGGIVWEKHMDNYAWSSPLAVYDKDGKAYIIACDSVGTMKLLDSKGTVLSTMSLGSNIEASPAVFENTLVVGTRGQQIFGIKIK